MFLSGSWGIQAASRVGFSMRVPLAEHVLRKRIRLRVDHLPIR